MQKLKLFPKKINVAYPYPSFVKVLGVMEATNNWIPRRDLT